MSSPSFRPTVGVLGAGRFGLALAEVVARNGHDVLLFTTLPERARTLRESRALPTVLPELERLHERIRFTTDPEELAAACTLVLVTASTEYATRVVRTVGACLDGAHQVVHAVHTLEEPGLVRMSQLISRWSCVRQTGVIAGPTHVSELLSQLPNAAVVGSPFPGVVQQCKRVLGRENFRIYGNPDIRGVELAAALGQVVAIAVGLADGLKLGAASHATVLTRGLAECARIGQRIGATPATFSGLAGLGRLVDAVRRGEANYQLGLDIGAGAAAAATVQGAPPEAQGPTVARAVVGWALENGLAAPIFSSVAAVLSGNEEPAVAMRSVLALDGGDD